MTFHRNFRPRIVVLAVGIAALGTFATGGEARADCEPDPYMGSICITVASYCPQQYEDMAGQVIPIHENPALYSLVGVAYGGNGHSTFGLPRGQGRTLISAGQGPGLTGFYLGDYAGMDQRGLYLQQLPTHTHETTFVPSQAALPTLLEVAVKPGTKDQPSSGDYKGITAKGSGTVAAYIASSTAGTTVQLGGVETTLTSSQGSALSETGVANPVIDTMPPQLGMRYCVAVDGTYPPRP